MHPSSTHGARGQAEFIHAVRGLGLPFIAARPIDVIRWQQIVRVETPALAVISAKAGTMPVNLQIEYIALWRLPSMGSCVHGNDGQKKAAGDLALRLWLFVC